MRIKKITPYILLALAVILADQSSKYLIVNYLSQGQLVCVIGDLLCFRFVFNEGGAMGTSFGPSWAYTTLTVVALVLIARYFLGADYGGKLLKISLSLIFGGAAGNLIDRIRFGKVVDFIDLDLPDIPFLGLYRWFTFNIADLAITIGLILFLVHLVFVKKDSTGDENQNSIESNFGDERN